MKHLYDIIERNPVPSDRMKLATKDRSKEGREWSGSHNPKADAENKKKHKLKEDGPTCSAGAGAVAGIGTGPQPEPGRKKKRKADIVVTDMLRRNMKP